MRDLKVRLLMGMVLACGLFACLGGCREQGRHHAAVQESSPKAGVTGAANEKAAADIRAARAKLSEEDRQLVDAQEWCVVSNENHLGSMSTPIKLMVTDQPVFICCKACEKEALKDPERTLAKLEELKAKKKAQTSSK